MTIDNETLLLLNAFHDGELSPGETLSMQQRLEREPELAEIARKLSGLSSALVDVLPGEPAPERLRGTILASLSPELTVGNAQENSAEEPGLKQVDTPNARWAIAASLLIGLVGGGLGGNYLARVTGDTMARSTIENEILAAHLRGLIAPQPFDIASSEGHVVKPWFNGKTTIAPTAPDFSVEGFPLVGGRIDIIGRTPVPVMVYRRRQHTISVTVTDSTRRAMSAQDVFNGTNVVNWTEGDLTYWAASDLNPGELTTFAELYRKRLAGKS
ncbi:anti-sigma factor [Agrobacterium sp. Ap1]|jgi:anti-sigma factor RsiW|uniref:anti-sigma factor family protein n=1 Tax=Rhizobium/Agrobacterium group TaxID=227290 RepID=UPI001A8EBC48|nr:anti-sigma factor [Agrobacterium sp. Ap1]MBO0143422.1 anti-sigma factor [Agrobacterium sp. Ap1]